MKKSYVRDALPYIALLPIAFMIACASTACLLFPRWALTDSSVFRYVAYLMQQGGVPYRDTFDHKGPLLYLINYLGILVDVNGVWLFEVLAVFVASIGAYKVLNCFCDKWLSVAGAGIAMLQLHGYLFGGNRVQEFALPFVCYALYVFVAFLEDRSVSKRQIAACGVCCMAVLLLLPNLTSLWIVGGIGVIILDVKQARIELGGHIGWFVAGMLMMAMPVLAYLVVSGAIHEFWNQYIVFNFAYTGTKSADFIPALIHYASQPVVAISCIALVVLLAMRAEQRATVAFGLAYLALSALVTALPGRISWYYCISLVPVCLVPLGMLLGILQRRSKSKIVLRTGAMACLAMALIPSILHIMQAPYEADFELSTEYQIASHINSETNSDETIAVCGNCDLIYVVADREAASRYSYQMPIAMTKPDIYDEFIADLEKSKPSIVLWSGNDLDGLFDLQTLRKYVDRYLEEYGYVSYAKISDYELFVRS